MYHLYGNHKPRHSYTQKERYCVRLNDYRNGNLKERFKVEQSRVHSKWNGSARVLNYGYSS